MGVKRLDIYKQKSKLVKTDQGFLKVPIRATRTGVFQYIMADGNIRRELRPPEEVFNADSMNSITMVPLTMTHPTEMVSVKNAKGLSIGVTGEKVEKADGRYIDITGLITDESAVVKVEDKANRGDSQEVSCGYTCDIEEKAGEFEGERYDVVQRNIRYNHVALVDRGRAGPNVKLRLDGTEGVLYDENINLVTDNEVIMKKVKLDGVEIEVSEEAAKAIESMQSKNASEIEAAQKEVKEANEKTDALTKEVEALKGVNKEATEKADTLTKEVEELKKTRVDHAQIDAMVAKRSAIVSVAEKIVKDFKKDGKSDLEIQKEVILYTNKELKLDGKSEEYVGARFDAIVENIDVYLDSSREEFKKRADNKDEPKLDARQKMIKDSLEAHKAPLKVTKK